MALVNENYLKLQGSYLFAEIAHRVQKFKAENPEAEVISLGIGDVTLPLPQVSIEAMHKAVDEMANKETFRGYGPEQGYAFLREKIRDVIYKSSPAHGFLHSYYLYSPASSLNFGNEFTIVS